MTPSNVDPNTALPVGETPDADAGARSPAAVTGGADDTPIIKRVEERLAVSKRQVAASTVRVTTVTEVEEDTAEVELNHRRVVVTRVPVGRVVDVAPPTRTEGDVTIVPVMEERFVVVKQIVLTEELHIRHVNEREVVRQTVPLRRQRAVVERRDAAGRIVPATEPDRLAPGSPGDPDPRPIHEESD